MDKLNAAFPDGYTSSSGSHLQKVAAGADLLVRTVENLTGLAIDHYAMIGLIGFYRISNAIGGVTVDMCQAVNDPTVNGEGSGFRSKAGLTTVTGTRALEFVRQRLHLPNGDLDRVRRQQYFLTATFRQAFSGDVFARLNGLLGAVQKSIITDDKLHPLTLGAQIENLTADNIASHTIPTDYYMDVEVHGGTENVGVLTLSKVRADVRSWIGITPGVNKPKTATSAPVGAATSGSSVPSTTSAPAAPSTSKTPARSTPIDAHCIN
jgi:LCP family protein required for cell wall assembly